MAFQLGIFLSAAIHLVGSAAFADQTKTIESAPQNKTADLACNQDLLSGIKDSIEFAGCLSELRSNCVPRNLSIDSDDMMLMGTAAALEISRRTVNFGIRHRAGQRAFSEAMKGGSHLTKLIADRSGGELFLLSRGALAQATAREAAKETASLALSVGLGTAEGVLAAGTALLYTNNTDCTETLEGAYTTMSGDGGFCKSRLALSKQMVNYLNMEPSQRNRLLANPRICGFYSAYAKALMKNSMIGRVNALKCDEKTRRPVSFSVHDGIEQVKAIAAYSENGELQRIRYVSLNDPSDRATTTFLFATNKGVNTLQSAVETDSAGRPSAVSSQRIRNTFQESVIEPKNAPLDRASSLFAKWNAAQSLMKFCCENREKDSCTGILGEGEPGPPERRPPTAQ